VPTATVTHDSSGNLYGTASEVGIGPVYKIDPAGAYQVIYTFTGGLDGGNPAAGVIFDPAGNL
jgi:uncharacterized repeat protein (TIGR03803 family)